MRTGECLVKPTGKGSLNQPMGTASTSSCGGDDDLELVRMFVMTPQGVLATDESVCLDAPERSERADRDREEAAGALNVTPRARIMACSGRPRQLWKHHREVRASDARDTHLSGYSFIYSVLPAIGLYRHLSQIKTS